MTLTRQNRQKRAFAMGTLYDSNGDVVKREMLKWEARMMFRGMLEEDAVYMGFTWVPREGADVLTWEDVR